MSPFFTGAVVVAICLFVLKEILEAFRRRASDRRRREAFRLLLADEIEKNNWVMGSLRFQLKQLKDVWDSSKVSIRVTPSGLTRLDIENDDEKTSSVMPGISRTIFAKLVTDIAVHDERLFVAAAAAYEAVSELEHVRNGLIEHVLEENEDIQAYRENFIDWAFKEVADAYLALSALYKICTGKELEDHKIRSFA